MNSIVDIVSLFFVSAIFLLISKTQFKNNIFVSLHLVTSCVIVSNRTIGADTKVYRDIFEFTNFESYLSLFTNDKNDFEFIWNFVIYTLKSFGFSVEYLFLFALVITLGNLLYAFRFVFQGRDVHLFIFLFWVLMYFQVVNTVRAKTASSFIPLIIIMIVCNKYILSVLSLFLSICFHRSSIILLPFSAAFASVRSVSYFNFFLIFFAFILFASVLFFSFNNSVDFSFLDVITNKFIHYFSGDFGSELANKPIGFIVSLVLINVHFLFLTIYASYLSLKYTRRLVIRKFCMFSMTFSFLSFFILTLGSVNTSYRILSIISSILLFILYDFFDNLESPLKFKLYLLLLLIWGLFLNFVFYSEIGFAF